MAYDKLVYAFFTQNNKRLTQLASWGSAVEGKESRRADTRQLEGYFSFIDELQQRPTI